MKVNLHSFLLVLLVIAGYSAKAQNGFTPVLSPQIQHFAPALQFLASPELEGREPGTRGATIAANYIAARMQGMGLKPCKKGNYCSNTRLSDYFQPFNVACLTAEKVSFSIPADGQNSEALVFVQGKDFIVENLQQDIHSATELVLAGYGINLPGLGYNDYKNINVKGRLAVIFNGYPGQHDSLSVAWSKFRSLAENDDYDLTERCNEAARQGAVAVVVINENFLNSAFDGNALQPIIKQDTLNAEPEYHLPGQLKTPTVSRIQLSVNSSRVIEERLGTEFRNMEESIARLSRYTTPKQLCRVSFNMQLAFDTVPVHNVTGLLQGKDTLQTIVLGAHYDHLGKRGNTIYYGSDDNASGVAGLLALAEMWTTSRVVPPCNILFASWTAEEKGLIGSEYFVSALPQTEKVSLYINMDMISRSVIEDTACRQLSIGTRTQDDNIRKILKKTNATLSKPFILNLWDVTGHSGSDYASFTAKGIPVMTFNTGLHNDYHTPRDISDNADLVKMGNVLKVINTSLQEVLDNISGK